MSLVLTGFHYAIGKTLSVYIAGLDCGDYVVANDGTIVVPYSSDPDGFFTATYLKAVSDLDPVSMATNEFASHLTVTIGGLPTDVLVPVLVGYTYNSDGQIVRPQTMSELKTKLGPAMGQIRRTHQYAMQLHQTIGLSVGVDFGSTLQSCGFKSYVNGPNLNKATGFTGIFQDSLTADYDFDNMISWRVSRPFPATVIALTGFIETSEG